MFFLSDAEFVGKSSGLGSNYFRETIVVFDSTKERPCKREDRQIICIAPENLL